MRTVNRRSRARSKSAPQAPRLTLAQIRAMPERYHTTVLGDCMSPLVENGAEMAFDTMARPQSGDLVVLFLRPEAIKPDQPQGSFKRMVLGVPHFVAEFPFKQHPDSEVSPSLVVECLNPPRRFYIPCSNVLAIHKCIGPAS